MHGILLATVGFWLVTSLVRRTGEALQREANSTYIAHISVRACQPATSPSTSPIPLISHLSSHLSVCIVWSRSDHPPRERVSNIKFTSLHRVPLSIAALQV